MVRRSSRVALVLASLLLWQGVIAPFTHAAGPHSAPDPGTAAVVGVQARLQTGSEGVPCHGADAMSESDAAGSHSTGHAVVPAAGAPEHADSNCCESLACQCACAHASISPMHLGIRPVVVPDHPAVIGAAVPAPQGPVKRLFKPPI